MGDGGGGDPSASSGKIPTEFQYSTMPGIGQKVCGGVVVVLKLKLNNYPYL